MAVLFDLYDNTGGATFSAAGGAITLNLDTVREEEPSGSGTPWDLTTDVITYNDTQVVVIRYDVTAEWSSTSVSTAADGFWAALEVDTGGGYAEIDGARSYAHPETGGAAGQTSGSTLARTHTSGDKYRVRVTGTGAITWKTVADASRFTITVDEYAVSGAPSSAQFLTLAADGGLANERVFTPGSGIAGTDAGAGSTYTLDLDINGLSADASPVGSTDYVATYDASGAAHKKVLLDNLPAVAPGFDEITTGSNTTATMTVGTGGTIVASGSGAITATAVVADSVALTTDTTGNYVASVTDGSGITGGDGGSEGAGLTLALDITGLAADASPDSAADYVATYDASGAANKKVLLDNLPGSSGAPSSASYITLGNDATLSAERVLTAGEGATFVDSGANGTATLAMDVPGLSAFTAPLATDYILVYDGTASAHKKVLISDFVRVQKTANTVTSVLTGAGGSAILGACVAAHIATMAESAFAGTPIADAVTALTDFRTNGDWRNLRNTDSRAIDRAQQALSIYTNWTGADS